MFLQKSCINFYISDEFLHFDLHKISKCANNACVRCIENRFRTEGRHCQKFSHCLISLCWWRKNIFPSLRIGDWKRHWLFMFYISKMKYFLNVHVWHLTQFIYHTYHEAAFWLWHASDKIRTVISFIDEIENPSMHKNCITAECNLLAKWQS